TAATRAAQAAYGAQSALRRRAGLKRLWQMLTP
ncbi:unnamed protein product, partial [marine sediment metagenome]